MLEIIRWKRTLKSFTDELVSGIEDKESILCVGLDPQIRYMPEHILQRGSEEVTGEYEQEAAARSIVMFFEEIIEAVAPYAPIAKPQRGFYEAYGSWGVWAFEEVVRLCRTQGLLVLEDAKRSDGGDTAKAYAAGHLGEVDICNPIDGGICKYPSLSVDAMTVMPQIGTSCMDPFIKEAKERGKGIFVVDKTSFSPNSEVEQLTTEDGLKVWEEIALMVQKWSVGCEGERGFNNVGVVMGATYPEDAPRMRELLPDCFNLVPGYGAQGGGADGAIASVRDDGFGVIVNSSRGINYAFSRGFKRDPKKFAEASGEAAEKARNDLNAALKQADKIPW